MNEQILRLSLPEDCIIERREIANLPLSNGSLMSYLRSLFTEVEQAVISAFKMFVLCTSITAIRNNPPCLPEEIWYLILANVRTVYVPSNKIVLGALMLESEEDLAWRQEKLEEYRNDAWKLMR